MAYKPVMLIILDGWGLSDKQEGNAIALAAKPFYDSLLKKYPHAKVVTSGDEVGLPKGQMGNSEVGHLNIGAGRVVYQELTRINKAIETGDFFINPVLNEGIRYALEKKKALHLVGLISDGGVHSHLEHLYALLEMAKNKELQEVYIHAILDGRDVHPLSAKEYLSALEKKLAKLGLGKIATVAGRYYTMDRDKRWDRVEKGYLAMVNGEGLKASRALEALEKAYGLRITDEFVEPTVIVDQHGKAIGQINENDAVIMFNFRADRVRQISHAFTDETFSAFRRPKGYLGLKYICMTEYDITLNAPVAYPPQNLDNTLGEYVSKQGLKQLRIAETEKYAHVTFFFNGGVEKAYPGEDRILIDSPKVTTYNLKPEMSACQISDSVIEKLKTIEYDLIVLNYANPDMVGHTGYLEAGVKAIECVDCCLAQVVQFVLDKKGALLITADHGNAEHMVDEDTLEPLTAHTSNQVPIILVADHLKDVHLNDGVLKDIAPTVLELMGLAKPLEMTGQSLIVKEG